MPPFLRLVGEEGEGEGAGDERDIGCEVCLLSSLKMGEEGEPDGREHGNGGDVARIWGQGDGSEEHRDAVQQNNTEQDRFKKDGFGDRERLLLNHQNQAAGKAGDKACGQHPPDGAASDMSDIWRALRWREENFGHDICPGQKNGDGQDGGEGGQRGV